MHILSTAHSGEGSTCILPTDRANALQGKQIEIQALAMKKYKLKLVLEPILSCLGIKV